MTAMRFVDTNIPVYAVSPRLADSAKRGISRDLLAQDTGNLAVSVQVLGEFYTQATRPTRPGTLTHHEAMVFITELRRHHVQPLTLETFDMALHYCERFGLNYSDCLILAAAKLSGCDAVYSEDMSSTQDYDGIRVINPFTAENETARV